MKPMSKTGLTLVELIVGITLMAMVAAALSAMTEHVLQVSTNVERLNQSTQLGLVVQRQFDSLVGKAVVTGDFPGLMYVETLSGQPGLAVRDVAGSSVPEHNEVVFLTYDPNQVNQWCAFRGKGNSLAPDASDAAAWNALFSDTIADIGSERHVITDRVATKIGNRPIVRFTNDLSPSAAQLQSYRDGFTAWDELPWPQDRFTAERGLQRQRFSILLMILDSENNALPIHLNHSSSQSIAASL